MKKTGFICCTEKDYLPSASKKVKKKCNLVALAWAEKALAAPLNGSCPLNLAPTLDCCQTIQVTAAMEK